MSQEKRLALLIDSDNVSPKYISFILQETQKYGTATYKRVYGDLESGSGSAWHYPAINNSLLPVHQSSYIAGKNATDFSITIDAMDILYSGTVDGFVLVTSDSDFTRLAIRLREAGMLVVGIGEVKTPRAFTSSCHYFSYLDQVCANEGMADEKTIRKATLDFVTANNDGHLDLAKIFAVLTSRFGNINFDEMGYKRFSGFIDSFSELRRSNTFVALKQKKQPKPAVKSAKPPTMQELSAAVAEFFEKQGVQTDNMMKLEGYLTQTFGKLDFSKYGSGSKRFAKFIDNLSGYTRSGTTVSPVSAGTDNAEAFRTEAVTFLSTCRFGANSEALNTHLSGKLGRDYLKNAGFEDLDSAIMSISGIERGDNNIFTLSTAEKTHENVESVTPSAMTEAVLRYARDCMPDGGNIGQLNNALIGRFGKNYCTELGFQDFKSMLDSITDIRVRKNYVYLTDAKYAEMVDAMRADTDEKQPEKPQQTAAAEKTVLKQSVKVESETEQKPDEQAAEKPTEETPVKRTPNPRGRRKRLNREPASSEKTAELKADTDKKPDDVKEAPAQAKESRTPEAAQKAEINAVRRDILEFAAANKNGSLAQLGNVLSQKYGKGYLKELGHSSIKKLLSGMPGIAVKGSNIGISEDFAARTAEIESFVNEFARGEGSHSIRALGIRLREHFEGFSYADYGFEKFTDFINAIDGVKADRYHISPVEE